MKAIVFFFLVLVFTIDSVAIAVNAPDVTVTERTVSAPAGKVSQQVPHQTWMQAMESSITPFEATSVDTVKHFAMNWLGWIVAIVFFVALLSLQLKARRKNSFLLRAGEADLILLPPVNNRRRRPR